jgi:hypothetical protein
MQNPNPRTSTITCSSNSSGRTDAR